MDDDQRAIDFLVGPAGQWPVGIVGRCRTFVMREKFGTIGTSSSYPSTAQAVVVRRIPTGGRKVSRAGSATTGESIRAFLNCRGNPGGKVYAGGRLASWAVGPVYPTDAEDGKIFQVHDGRLE